VCGSGVRTSATFAKVDRPREWYCFSKPIDTATSFDVKGWPSCQRTPSRNLNVYCKPSALIDHAVASCARGCTLKS
jgi:hypothetical protein